MQTINVDLNKIIKNASPILVKRKSKMVKGALGDISIDRNIIIPPLNTRIDFSTFLPSISASQYPGLRDVNAAAIPSKFNWRQNGDPAIRKQITKPPNQHNCGSCWAVSSATVISDNFVVSKKIQNPLISPTYILSCTNNPSAGFNQCNGGNPAALMQLLGGGTGVASDHCIDYSWCTKNSDCNPPPGSGGAEGAVLNQLIPGCGCYKPGENYLYFIKNNSSVIPNSSDGKISPEDMIVVKHHIMNVGPVVSGFVVLSNFISGKFADVESQEGVYLENGIYDDGQFRLGDGSTNSIKGAHAISVIGWGITKNPIVVDKDNNGNPVKKRVPYWYCRNSWSEKWGDGGYFKFAMYPFNKMSLVGNKVVVSSGGTNYPSGGLILIEPKNFQKTNLPTINKVYSSNPNDLIQNPDFYNNDPQPKKIVSSRSNPKKPENNGHSKKLNAGQIAGIVIGSLIGLFVLIMILRAIYYYVLYKNFKKALKV